MIPKELNELVRKQHGEYLRADAVLAKQGIEKLGIDISSQFGEFYLSYCVSVFCSESSYEELLDISEPTEQILNATEFVREVWELPDVYVCISSPEGEGCYLYSKETGEVLDFSLESREEFPNGKHETKWPDFYSFMIWYLGPA